MKRVLSVITLLAILLASVQGALMGTNASGTVSDTFSADFSKADGWTGLTEYLGASITGDRFGTAMGWNNSKGSITTERTFNFGKELDVDFSLYTSGNNNVGNAHEDFYITVGEFKIAICDFQTRIEIYYDGIKIDGVNNILDNKSESIRQYTYNVHIEAGKITAQNDILKYTSDFSDFEAVNGAQVSVTINEDWQIYEEYFSDLFVGYKEPVMPKTEFTADFTNSDGWSGLTEYLGAGEKGDGFGSTGWNNKIGTLTSKEKFNFGKEFDIDFSLYTIWRNGNLNGEGEDFYITVGKFKIAICDYQTRIEIYYDGKKIEGTNACSDNSYIGERNYHYTAHIEAGNICVENEIVKYTSEFSDFDAVDNAIVSITLNEDWQIWSERFADLYIGYKEPVVPKTEFTADFTNSDGWSGLTEYLGAGEKGDSFGTDIGWGNKTGALISNDIFNFGKKTDLRFRLRTVYRNGNENGTNEDFYITVGKFKIAICDFQSRIVMYYDNKEITGTSTPKASIAYPKSGDRDYSYIVKIEKGNITLESDLLIYKSNFDGFAEINDAKLSISINETWQIWGEYFYELTVNVPEKVYENGGNLFCTRFEDNALWEGDLAELIDTEMGQFPSDSGWNNKTGKMKTAKVYNFSSAYSVWFSLKTANANTFYHEINDENKENTDYVFSVGDLSIMLKHYQNGITVAYKGDEIITVYSKNASFEDEKDYEYILTVEGGKISVRQMNGDNTLLTLNCEIPNIEPADNSFVSFEIKETYHISSAKVGYILISDKSNNIKSAFAYFAELENQKYDWSDKESGGNKLTSDFSDKAFWIDELTEYVITEENCFKLEGWHNKTGKITTAKWYSFGSAAIMRFDLITSWLNGEKSDDRLKEANYRINLGKFSLEIRYFQNAMALYYDGELIKEITAKTQAFDEKSYSYMVIIDKGNIIVRQMKGAATLMELKSDFSAFDPLDKVRLSIEVLEDWQIYTGIFKNLSVEELASYKSLYSFNAAKDISEILTAEDIERAWIKSQWSLKQKFKDGVVDTDWNSDSVEKKMHVSGFYTSIPYDPATIPVIQTKNGEYTSQVGLYDGLLFVRANTPGNERQTALGFEAPADGTIRLHDPNYGMAAVPTIFNGENLWCLDYSETVKKSIHFTIYKNDEIIWPKDEADFLFVNANGKSAEVNTTPFPDIVVNVKQGDMIYLAIRPEHYNMVTGDILSINPSVVSMNPQIDYIKLDGEIKLNTDREPVKEVIDINIASTISEKSAKLRALSTDGGLDMNVNTIIVVSIIGAVAVAFVLTVVIVKKKRRLAR